MAHLKPLGHWPLLGAKSVKYLGGSVKDDVIYGGGEVWQK